MIRALLAIVATVRQSWLIELAGAGLLVAAAWIQWGLAAGLAAAGVALVLKAYSLEATP